MKWIGVIGTRERDSLGTELPKIKQAILALYSEGDMLVSGGCPQGADNFAEMIARREQIPIMIHYAKWNKLGKAAGFIRNGTLAEQADVLIACVSEDRTGGTEDTIKKFLKSKGLKDEIEAMDKGLLRLI